MVHWCSGTAVEGAEWDLHIDLETGRMWESDMASA